MCGIAAIFAYTDSAPCVDAGELLSIRDCMTARGPDGAGEWYGPGRRVGLAHRRLSIIDLSPGGAQPMLLPERQLAITFNGEIYNYRELRTRLEAAGHVFHSTSDTEVLLRLYAEYGEAMLNELRGMYAFAIWDGAKRGLLLARDPFGIKPLYYADNGKTFRLASQVKALLAGGQIDTSPEPAGHVGFFLWGHAIEPYTMYRGIRSLPAGAMLWVDQSGNKRQKTFCSVTGMFAEAERSASLPSPLSHLPSSAASLRASLVDSVRHHLVADVPVGIFLSSGLDSTTLTALAAEQGGTLRTVTLGFEEYRGTANDETPLAETVARQYGAKHQTVWVKRADFQDHVERLFTAMDLPSIDGVNTYFVSLAATRASLKVAISGLGGDELFGGYPSFKEIPRAVGALGSLRPGNVFGGVVRTISAPLLRRCTSPKYAGLLEYGGSYGGAYLLRRGMFMPWELPEFLDADLVRQGWAELQPIVRLDETHDGIRSPRAKVSCLEMCWYMRNQLLRDSDWAGMAHSLEIRVPLVDVGLLRAVAPMLVGPTAPTKLDMAASPLSPLPSSVLDRPKTGFTIPVRQWLLEIAQPSTLNSQPSHSERGLRGWTKYVYGRFAGTDLLVKHGAGSRGQGAQSRKGDSARSPLAASPTAQPSTLNPQPPSSLPPAALRVLVLATDAFGGHGGIAKFNRDLLAALAGNPTVQEVVALPRLVPGDTGDLPAKLKYITTGVGGKLRYIRAVLKAARSLAAPCPTLVVCGHINLLPVAWLARRLIRKAESRKLNAEFRDVVAGARESAIRNPQSAIESTPFPAPCSLLLVIHGIDAWQPTRSWIVNRLVRSVDAFISVSELTKRRFLAWARLDGILNFILPNCVDLDQFTPGPKNPRLLERHGLRDRTVLLTVARLSAQERYKGIDEVLEVLPGLAKQFPNLTYLIVGDGADRERLVNKARSLGLSVRVEEGSGQIADDRPQTTDHALVQKSAIRNPQSAITIAPAPQVLFTGWVGAGETVEHFRLADAFVMAGRGEGFGIVYLEALACGIPVVASKADAGAEVMRGCELAVLVDPANRADILSGIQRALTLPRGVVPPQAEFFSVKNFDRRCSEIINSLLAGTPSEAAAPPGWRTSGDLTGEIVASNYSPQTAPVFGELQIQKGPGMNLSQEQTRNWEWWEHNPMTYDWEETLHLTAGSREWFEEIDRRFLSCSYFARDQAGKPFGRFLHPEFVAGKDVLEVGCGMGTHASLLARAGARLTAIDLTERAVQTTRRRFEMFGLPGKIERADAEKLPFPDASFDFVWSWGVIHHSSRFESCLAEIARVLRPGGRLMLMVYYRPCIVYYVNCGFIRGILLRQLRRKSLHQIYVDSSDGFYARVFNRPELTAQLLGSFSQIKLQVVGLKAELFPIPRTRFKEKLENATPDWLASTVLGRWGSMIVAEAVRN